MRGTTISIFLLIIQMLLFNQDSAFSCSCVGPNTFFKSVNKHVLEVKFLNYDTIWFKSGTTLSEYSVTMVEVIENIGSDVNSDTIPILVDKGFECFQSLKIKNEYKSYIITGSMDKMFLTTDTTINFVETEVMVLGLCTEPQVFVDIDGKVSGNLTRNRIGDQYAKANKYQMKNRKKRAEKIYSRLNASDEFKYYQTISRAKFNRKVKERLLKYDIK